MPRLLLALAALLALTFPAAQAVEATPKGAAPKIAVLRLEDVLRQSKSYLIGMEGWNKQKAEAQASITAIDEQLKRLDGQLQVLKPDSENFGKLQEELEVLKLKKKVGFDRARAELERRQVALVKDSFKQMRQALAGFCQERGIMLVHLAPDPDLGAPTFNDVVQELGMKTVLYFDPALDVTDAFIAYLNAAGDKPTDKPATPATDVKTAP